MKVRALILGYLLALPIFGATFAAPAGQESLLELVRQVRAGYPAIPTDPQLCEMLNTIAWTANGNRADGPWGLSAKPGGTRCIRTDGQPLAHDIIHHRPTNRLFDVFVAAGAESTPAWSEVGHHQDPNRPWVAAIPPGGTAPPPPPPPCPYPDVREGLAQCRTEADALERRIATIEHDLDTTRDRALRAENELAAAAARIVELEARKIPTGCEGQRILGFIKTSCRLVY